MTEDLLEEHSEVLAKLGTSAEGAHLRARMQSACLLSDMESFKVRDNTYIQVQVRNRYVNPQNNNCIQLIVLLAQLVLNLFYYVQYINT